MSEVIPREPRSQRNARRHSKLPGAAEVHAAKRSACRLSRMGITRAGGGTTTGCIVCTCRYNAYVLLCFDSLFLVVLDFSKSFAVSCSVRVPWQHLASLRCFIIPNLPLVIFFAFASRSGALVAASKLFGRFSRSPAMDLVELAAASGAPMAARACHSAELYVGGGGFNVP